MNKAVALTMLFLLAGALRAQEALIVLPPVEPLTIRGETYYDPAGKAVRFWGVNVVSLFPTHKAAEQVAADIAGYGFNLVRPHHMMRPSLDWNINSKIPALVDYKGNTHTLDREVLDRFDYFNAELRKRGVYLAFALRWSRTYRPDDADILVTDGEDKGRWLEALRELEGWDWRRSIDSRKLLPVLDERCWEVEKAFIRNLLTHVNPYTGVAYGQDPQIISLEVINEATCEYTLICQVKERLPEYWQNKLTARWERFLADNGAASFNLWDASSAAQKELRTAFYRALDREYFSKAREFVRSLGCNTPMMYSNLPHSEGNGKLTYEMAEVVETHSYVDPRVVSGKEDFVLGLGRAMIAGKPFFIGEFNQSEGGQKIREEQPFRTMLPLAAAAYGGLHNFSGVVWFSWQHGDRALDDAGRVLAASYSRDRGRIGDLMSDNMQLDHMRTCGLIFRKGLAAPSVSPVTVTVDDPLPAGDYHELVRPKYQVKPGWQSVHGLRRAYGPRPAEEAAQDWFTREPESPLLSDTGEILKDIARRQLTLAAPQAEAISGWLDGKPGGGLKHLQAGGEGIFVTVVAVALDDRPLAQSRRILLSRSGVDGAGAEVENLAVSLAGLSAGEWSITLCRPQENARVLRSFNGADTVGLSRGEGGVLLLPEGGWHEYELRMKD